jgi:hypothetical protein
VEGPRLMGVPRAECPAMDNPRTCLPRTVLGARENSQIVLKGLLIIGKGEDKQAEKNMITVPG